MLDKQIQDLIKKEEKRQKGVINLIASENYVSKDVLDALVSPFINKYAEGYIGARYYQGNGVVDEVEALCIERALKLFHLSFKDWHVNVQSLSGTPANFAIYNALIEPGEKIMGLELSHGGHLSHGFKASLTGKFWKQVPYGVSQKTERLDYNEIRKIAKLEKPKIIITGYTAYSRKINFKEFREIADEVGAYLHVDMSHFAGLVAGGAYASPFRYADTVMATTHKTLRGPRSAIIWIKKELRRPTSKLFKLGEGVSKKLDRVIFPGMYGGPHINQIAAVAVALYEAGRPDFKKYAEQIVLNAKVLAEGLKSCGWRIISGGTDTHLLLIDTWMGGKGIGGKEAAQRLEEHGVIVNKNSIPFDVRTPLDPSGIRLGTAAETTRGKKEKDMAKIAQTIDKILRQ
jgi:glycine hydroxymethyltransferase